MLSLFASLPVVSVLVEELDRPPLIGSGGEAMLVGVWPRVAVVVDIGDEGLVVGDEVAASVGARSPVGSATLVLLVVLGSAECTYMCRAAISKAVQ